MSDADKQTVMDTRKKNKAKGGTPHKRKVSDVSVQAQIADMKKSIVAAIKQGNASNDDDTSATDDSSVADNAGDSFGGRNKKKIRKGWRDVIVSTVQTKKLTEKKKVVTFDADTLFRSVVSVNKTSTRHTSSINKSSRKRHNRSHTATYGCMELDSHADTIVLGSNAILMQYTTRECDVSPYADSYEPIRNVPIVSGATAVTSSRTGMTYILVFNKAI